MSAGRYDRPRIAGAAGGVGTTSIAYALHGEDAGIYRAGDPVDVLVCRSTMFSVGNAQRALSAVPPYQPPPLLAVVDDIPGASSSHVKTRLRMTEGVVAAVVAVPFVADWRNLDDPHTVAMDLLRPGTEIPRSWRAFIAAMHDLVAEVAPLLQARRTGPVPPPPLARAIPPSTGQPARS